MLTRTTNPNYNRYKDYGGRGIKVSARWRGKNGFENFLKDMGDKPSDQHTLDRIDNDKDYSVENCRWSTPKEQTSNRRFRSIGTNNTSGKIGVTLHRRSKRWQATLRYKGSIVYQKYFDTKEEAVLGREEAESLRDRGQYA